MKKFTFLHAAVVLTAIFISSCSIEKRHYLPGYHIEWKHKVRTAPAPAQEEKKQMETGTSSLLPAKPAINDGLVTRNETAQQPVRQQHLSPPDKTLPYAAAGRQHGYRHFRLTNTAKKPAVFAEHKIFSSPKPTVFNSAQQAISDDARLIFAIIFLIFGLSPFAVLIYVGPGGEFSLDLALWLAGLILLVIGAAVVAPALIWVGWIFLIVAWIYALIVMLRRAV